MSNIVFMPNVYKHAAIALVLIIFFVISGVAGDVNQTSNESMYLLENTENQSVNISNTTTVIVRSGERIQAAIQDSLPGSIIEVHSGTYRENINVTKRLTIRGVDDGDGPPVVDAYGKGSAIIVSANGTLLENLTIANSSLYGMNGIAGIRVTSSNCVIKNCHAYDNYYGIYLSNSDNNTLIGNNLSNNEKGIRFVLSNDNFLLENIVLGNKYSTGIELANSKNNTLASNNLSSNGNGIRVALSDNNSLLENNVFGNKYGYGIELANSKNNTLAGNNLVDGGYGINLDSSSDNRLSNNSMSGNKQNLKMDGKRVSDFDNDIDATNLVDGKSIYYFRDARDKIINRISDAGLVGCFNCTNITLRDQNISDSDTGILIVNTYGSKFNENNLSIRLYFSNNNTISDNNIRGDDYGVLIYSSANNTLVSNTAYGCNYGIDLESSNANILISNNLSNNEKGIRLALSNDNFLLENNILGNKYGTGIELANSKNNTLAGNNLVDGGYGINLDSSSDNRLSNNSMSGNKQNFKMDGKRVSDFDNDIDATNLVDGKSIYYFKDARDKIINRISDAGLVGCFNCTNITLRDQNIPDSDTGILIVNTYGSKFNENNLSIRLYFSNNNTISDNNIRGDDYGALIYSSDNNTFFKNIVFGNKYGSGIRLELSNNNTLVDNNFSNNPYCGIELCDSTNNNILNNNASSSGCGVGLESSNNNFIINNNFGNNSCGINLYASDSNIISDNTARKNYYGISFEYSDKNILKNNSLLNNFEYGVKLLSSHNNNILENNASNSDYGFSLESSYRNSLVSNLANENEYGINFVSSSNNRASNNSMFGNMFNFQLDGIELSDFDNEIDSTNLVNGRPIYYITDANNETIDSISDAGLVLCFNCTNITVRGLSIANVGTGIGLYKTNHSIVESSNLTNIKEGIYLYNSINNKIRFNTISNGSFGIKIVSSSNNRFEKNSVSNNITHPIEYDALDNNTFFNNSEKEIENKSLYRHPLRHPPLAENGKSGEIYANGKADSEGHMLGRADGLAEPASSPPTKSSRGESSGGMGLRVDPESEVQPTATELYEKLYFEQVESLPKAQIVFTPPGKMLKGVPKDVVAIITRNLSLDLNKTLHEYEEKVRKEIKVSCETSVELDGGKNFDIWPEGPIKKFIPLEGQKEWRWTVTPLYKGTHTLELKAYTKVNLSEAEPDFLVLKENIVVEVDYLLEAKNALFGGGRWIITLFITVLVTGLVNWLSGGILNKAKSLGKESEEPSEESEKTELEE